MPDYLSSLGGEDYKGFIIGLFTVVAAISRPVSGKTNRYHWTITYNVFWWFSLCCCLLFIPLVCHCIWISYAPFFSWNVYWIYAHRYRRIFSGYLFLQIGRGEAMGIVGIMNNVGFMGGNASSSLITEHFGINALFYISALLALLSVASLIKLKESMSQTHAFQWKQLKINFSDVYDKRVYEPAVVMILTTMTFGAMLTLIPDYSKHLGIMNKGLFLSRCYSVNYPNSLMGGKVIRSHWTFAYLHNWDSFLGNSYGFTHLPRP